MAKRHQKQTSENQTDSTVKSPESEQSFAATETPDIAQDTTLPAPDAAAIEPTPGDDGTPDNAESSDGTPSTPIDNAPTPIASHRRISLGSLYRPWIIGGGIAGLVLAIGLTYTSIQLHQKGSFSDASIAGLIIRQDAPRAKTVEALRVKLEGIRISIAKPDGSTDVMPIGMAGVRYDVAASVEKVLAHKRSISLWQRVQFWREDAVQPVTTIDPEKLQAYIDEHVTIVTTKPITATLSVKNGQVIITPDTPGAGLSDPNAAANITNAAYNAQTALINLREAPIPAAVKTVDVETVKRQIEAAMAQPISFTISNRSFTPTQSTVGDWVEPIVADSQKATLEYNTGSIQAYLDKIAAPYVSLPRAEISMVNADGTNTVLVPGKNGTDITNKTDVAKRVAVALKEAKAVQEQLGVASATYGKVLAQEYDKWIEVNLATKRMTAYEKSNPVKVFKISAGAPATPTEQGHFKIYAKVRRQDMRGLNVDGSRYFQPNVEWVNYFYGDQAIHGNYWRPASWFGVHNSSHGCVGLMNPDAEWIYNWAPVGTPIINHE